MKYIAALTCLLLAAFTAPSFAHEMTNDCAAQAAKIADKKESIKFEKDCLAKVEKTADEHEQHDKQEHCDTNAKTMKLEGKDKKEYLEHCYHESDFNKNQKPYSPPK